MFWSCLFACYRFNFQLFSAPLHSYFLLGCTSAPISTKLQTKTEAKSTKLRPGIPQDLCLRPKTRGRAAGGRPAVFASMHSKHPPPYCDTHGTCTQVAQPTSNKYHNQHKFSIQVLYACMNAGVPCGFENPCNSPLWNVLDLVAILGHDCVKIARVEFCSCGTPWRKRTKLLLMHVGSISSVLELRCKGRGVCPFSGKPHQPLSGRNRAGVCWMSIAAPYPKRLCILLPHIFNSSIHNDFMNKLKRYI